MENKNTPQLPIDIEAINKTSEDIVLKKIELEAEKLKLDDLAEIMSNFKQLADAYINVSQSDYTEKWYNSLLEKRNKSENNSNYNNIATIEDAIKKAA